MAHIPDIQETIDEAIADTTQQIPFTEEADAIFDSDTPITSEGLTDIRDFEITPTPVEIEAVGVQC